MPRTVLWWIKKDFRLADNPALTAALADGARVVPVFLFEPAVLAAPETSGFHVAAWGEAFAALADRIAEATGRAPDACALAVHGDAVETLGRLRELVAFDAIHSHQEHGSDVTFSRDKAVAAWCRAEGVAWHEHRQTGVFRALCDRDARSKKWKAFTADGPLPPPSADALARVAVPDAAQALAAPDLAPGAFGHPLSEAQWAHRQPVSESAAEATLTSFLTERGQCYSGGISSPNTAFVCGSRLSVHLAWGTMTGRQAYHATEARQAEVKGSPLAADKQWAKSLRAFKSRLHWRDHFVQRLESAPEQEFRPLNAAYEALPTPGDPHLGAWLEGRTGWPLVDACMRCAATTGFLNFRMRAFVTSAAVHSLRIDWRKTLYPAARLWADYEPGIHISQTQMQAGVVGINQLRVYSPPKQLADHDAGAVFVKRWVPELADVPPEAIMAHPEPHLMGSPVDGYPRPLVDWKASSKAMKDDYYAIKALPETRALADAVYAAHGSRRSPKSRTWTSNTPRVSSVPRAGTRRIVRLADGSAPPADGSAPPADG